ncbi:MAG: hypothetical protein F2534_21985 [Actinobacteria bacterium]|uniref:Unannotated protein n=1 Tax=freshwater metagenome TaxID=449393 RepID=A0A6J6GFP7_9ZZZZ|nr:hypothetical protein [Actinomycetota bacterium]
MAGETTALFTFSTRSTFEELHGPAGSRLWRPGWTGCLIEKHLPMWVTTPVGYAADGRPRKVVTVSHGLHDRPAVADLVVVVAGLFGGSDDLRSMAEREGLLHVDGQRWWVQPSVTLPSWGDMDDDPAEEGADVDPIVASDELFAEAARVVAERCRVSVMAYPNSIATQERSVEWLRGEGVDVDEFRLAAAGSPAR